MSSTLVGNLNSSSDSTARPYRPHRPHHMLPVSSEQFEDACRKLFHRLSSLRAGSTLDVRSWGFSFANRGDRPIPIEVLLMGWGSISKTHPQLTFDAYKVPPPFIVAQMFWLQYGLYLVNLSDDSISPSLNIVLLSHPPRSGQLYHAERVHHGNVIPQEIDQNMIAFYIKSAPLLHVPPTRVVVQAVHTAVEFPAIVSGQTDYSSMAARPAAPGTEEHNRAFEIQRAFRQPDYPTETIREFHQMTVALLVTKAEEAVEKILREASVGNFGESVGTNATLRFSQEEQFMHSGNHSVNIQSMIYGFQNGPNFEQRQQYWVELGLENPFVLAQRNVYKSTKHFLRNFSNYQKKAGLFVVVHSLCPRGPAKMWHGQDISPENLFTDSSARSERFVVPKYDRSAISFPSLHEPAAAADPEIETVSAWDDLPSYASISSRPTATIPNSWDDQDGEDDWEKATFVPLVKKPQVITRDETDEELELRIQFQIDTEFEERHAELLEQRKKVNHDLIAAKRAIKRRDAEIERAQTAVADAQGELSALEKERVVARRAAIAEAKLVPRRKIVIAYEDSIKPVGKVIVAEPIVPKQTESEPTKMTRATLWGTQMRNLSHYASLLV